jgi:hypothetical protein
MIRVTKRSIYSNHDHCPTWTGGNWDATTRIANYGVYGFKWIKRLDFIVPIWLHMERHLGMLTAVLYVAFRTLYRFTGLV